MTGDGLQDLVLLRSGNLTYWPNLGYGRWGDPVRMRQAPRFPDGFDPRRVLLGDVDGDGLADLIYVDDGKVLLWGNQSGNAFTADPVTVYGTPRVVDTDAIQLADLHGTGMAGLLYTRPADTAGASGWRYLDLTGEVKPYLLTGMDNHLGASTTVTYQPSTAEYLRDQADPATRWRTTLPFPVHVVARGRGPRRALRRPAGHPVPLPPRLLGRRRAGVPRVRLRRPTRRRNLRPRSGSRYCPRSRRRPARAPLPAHPDPHLVPPRPRRRR